MKHFAVPTLALLLLACAPSVAQARPAANVEAQQNRQQRADDALDLVRLQALMTDFDEARLAASPAVKQTRLDNIDARLRKMLRQENRESAKELGQDRRETRRSRRQARRTGDRRGLRDDRRDKRKEKRSDVRRDEIGIALVPTYGRYDESTLSTKRQLIGSLIALAKQEKRHNRQERREDRRAR